MSFTMENVFHNTAYLSNIGDIISFTFKDITIRFRGPYSLIKIDKVKAWDNGYIVVDAYYEHDTNPIEDYIDINPILEDLYINAEEILPMIKSLEVRYA